MCQTRQNGFGQTHIPPPPHQVPMKLNDFADNLLVDSIDVLDPL